jgi:hypothetical protein
MPPADRPDHAPRGFEWLPDAYQRDIEPLGEEARENMRQALADGDVEAILRSPYGPRKPVLDHMWEKDDVERKVYRRFEDGWMRAKYGPDKIPFCGWIFVEKKTWAKAVAALGGQKTHAQFSENSARAYYKEYVKKIEAKGEPPPSRDDDINDIRDHFQKKIPKAFIIGLRSELAPDHWKTPGPKVLSENIKSDRSTD